MLRLIYACIETENCAFRDIFTNSQAGIHEKSRPRELLDTGLRVSVPRPLSVAQILLDTWLELIYVFNLVYTGQDICIGIYWLSVSVYTGYDICIGIYRL